VKISRLVLVVFVAVILSAPAAAAVSPDGPHAGVQAHLSAIKSTGAVYAGELLVLAREQLTRVVTELR
jgi:hypothetical protein